MFFSCVRQVPIKPFGRHHGRRGARDSVIINKAHLEKMHAAGGSAGEAAAAATIGGDAHGGEGAMSRHESFSPAAAGTEAAAADGEAAAEGEHHVHFE